MFQFQQIIADKDKLLADKDKLIVDLQEENQMLKA